MKCLNCGNENKDTNIRCEVCGTELKKDDNFLNKDHSKDNGDKIDSIFKVVQFVSIGSKIIALLIGIGIVAFFISCLAQYIIQNNGDTSGYLETQGSLVRFESCIYDKKEEVCRAIYEYTVDGVTYEGSPNSLSGKSWFKSTITVKYDPKNPSKYAMSSGLKFLPIFVVVIVLFVFLSIFVPFKRHRKELKNR